MKLHARLQPERGHGFCAIQVSWVLGAGLAYRELTAASEARIVKQTKVR